MTIIQLEYLLAVANCGSFSLAAEHCFVTQPSLSMQVKALEEELGVVLLDRSKKPVIPTEAGEVVLEQARETIKAYNYIKEAVSELKGETAGKLRLGVIPTIAPYLLHKFIPAFVRDYPKVELEISEMITSDIVDALKRDRIDAALVASGAYHTVVVTAGGCTAKLGMNGKDHVNKDMPVLEDMLGGFSVLISANDGENPEIDTDIIGRHTVGTGSSPQAVIGGLVAAPLARAGLKIPDIDKYAAEMQNPDITKPAGAGDVPASNYKMIGALAVKQGDMEKAKLASFAQEHGMVGWAPTQGHIPSGVPYVGFLRDEILSGQVNTAMIIGKGSLFLGRMTNLFDGVSFVVRKNAGAQAQEGGVSKAEIKGLIAEALRDFAASMME